MKLAKAQRAVGLGFAHAALIVVSAFSLFPVLWVVSMALNPHSTAEPTSLELIPRHVSLAAFAAVISHPTEVDGLTFGRLLANSLLVSGGTALLSVLLGATAAFAFSRFKFRGRNAGLMTFMLLQLFPSVCSLAPLFVLLSALRLRTTLVGLAIAYAAGTLPFAIWNLKGYFDTVSAELEEAALIDGCSYFTAFWRIILPLSAPAVAVTTLFGFMAGWTEIILAWTFLENPKTFTLSMALYGMVGQYGTTKPWSDFAAMAILLSLPVVIVMLILQRYIVAGLTAGGVKG